jgi:hypothetical protein
MAHHALLPRKPMPAESSERHLEAAEVAAYLDRALPDEARSRVEAHLDGCAECRAEVVQVARLVRTAPLRRTVTVPIGLAAAAALILLLTPSVRLPSRPEFREPAITTTAAPTAIAPRNEVIEARQLIWSAVPRAGRYRVMLLDVGGTLMWRTETADTVASIPDSVRLRAGATYFWKVEAETAYGRWVASDLVDFTVGGPSR